MNSTYKIALLLFLTQVGIGQSKNFLDKPYLETSAKVDTSVIPDRIYLSIYVTERDTKGKQSTEELEFKMANKLKELGVQIEEQLFLADVSSNFKKHLLKKKDINKVKGYELLVFDAKTAGKVILGLENVGISNVDLLRTEYSKIDEIKLELKSRAVKKAKRQAEALAFPLNQTIGKAIHISDTPTYTPNILEGRVSGIKIRGASSMQKTNNEIPIDFEKIKIVSEISIKFVLN